MQKIIQDLGGVTQVRELINSYSAQLLQQIMNGLTSFLTSLTSLPSTLINLFINIGVTIGTILIMTHSVTLALLFVAYVVILQQFEGNFIYPYVVGGSTGLPGIWVIFAITIGSALGGILGMLVSVPVAATLYQIVKDNVVRREEAKAANAIENND